MRQQRWRDQAEQHWLFFRQWMRAPLSTASVVPSSRYLAEKMVRQVPAQAKHVIELGAGTGVFTERLLAREPQLEELFVLELNPEMHAQLSQRFSRAHVICGNAMNLSSLVNAHARFQVGEADAVVSGLGLLNMPVHVVNAILQSCFDVLRPGAPLVQFTYGPTCPVSAAQRAHFGLSSERVAFTLRNFPPASVYVIRRK